MEKFLRMVLIMLITFVVSMFCLNLVGLGILAFYSSVQHFVLFLSLVVILTGIVFEVKYHTSLQ